MRKIAISWTSFCGLVCLASLGWAQQEWGHLTARIKVSGQIPPAVEESIDKDQAACMKDGQKPLDDNLVVSNDGYLRDVFLMMYFKPGAPAPAVHSSYEAMKNQALVLDNVNCRFVPHALFVRTGQTITMKNSDDVGHNCHIVTIRNEENINLAQHSSVDVKLKESDKTPGNVVCDIHKWMDAVILVRDEPYAAVSGEDGRLSIENIPAGKWTFQLWHKKAGYLADLPVPGGQSGRRGEFDVEIVGGVTLDLGEIVVPAKNLSK